MASPVAAQFPSLPFDFRPLHDPYPTYSVFLDYGLGLADISQLQMLAGRATLESEKLRGGIGLGLLIREGAGADDELAFSGAFAYNVRGPFSLVVADVQLGFSYFESGGGADPELRQLDIPFGLAAGISGRLPFEVISNVEPWLALRGQVRRTELSGSGSDVDAWRAGGGLTAGLGVLLPAGFGARLAVEWLMIRSPTASEWDHEVVLGLAALWRR
ncbi:MAG: hypothetical protein GWN99_13295 [Gemmatimonadetes bacterium]|nr:hypothetical protein [Gemmatimonadota bacterium]NIS02022.1 hypothetical protein [Gemmatimonadota bacterium]NIT67826.1 hypothetical protein [Gemmatimonadota bacterium]NIU53813.1 hypothetical protein [Gemmatimonadota bacterium]NIV24512.1 hypothetical protein [Gemmatimonadota bacterium]